jgi:hypothetical protein
VADSLIEPVNIQIPYSPQLAELFPTNQERYHRDFEKVLALVKASALWHQYQRDRTEDGAVIADRRDYELVYGLSDVFTESVLPLSQPALKFLKLLEGNPDLTRVEAQKALSVSERTLKRYIDAAKDAGFLETEGRGTKQTFKVVEMPETQTVLPPSDKIFAYLPGVRLSNFNQTPDIEREKLDTGYCPMMSDCRNGQEEAAGTDRQPDNRTGPDNGGCPMETVDTQASGGNRTIGQEKKENIFEYKQPEYHCEDCSFFGPEGCRLNQDVEANSTICDRFHFTEVPLMTRPAGTTPPLWKR